MSKDKDKFKVECKKLGYKLRTIVRYKDEVILFLESQEKGLEDVEKDFSKFGRMKYSGTQPDHFYIAMEIKENE